MTPKPIDMVASDLTFTDPLAALAELRRRAPEAAAPLTAVDAPTLQNALLAFGLQLVGDPHRACSMRCHPEVNDRRAVMECALETIAPFVRAGGFVIGRSDHGPVWRWTFTGEAVVCERGSLAFVPDSASWAATVIVNDTITAAHGDAVLRQLAAAVVGCGIREFDLSTQVTSVRRRFRRIVGDRTLVGPGASR